jgi:hypothetical protein
MSSRISETVKILTKIRELGISQDDAGYVQTKLAFDSWIKTGLPSSHEIPFTSVDRVCHLELPAGSKSVKCVLKATETLKTRYAAKSTKDNDMD